MTTALLVGPMNVASGICEVPKDKQFVFIRDTLKAMCEYIQSE